MHDSLKKSNNDCTRKHPKIKYKQNEQREHKKSNTKKIQKKNL